MNKTSSAVVRTLLLGTSCLTVLSLGAAKADPTGGTVVTGAATINSRGGNTTINQSTNRALINWDSFSIAAGGQVRFNQPGTGSITLNRVIGSAPSSIYGSILANGQVWLINSNGILFGRGAQVNVGGLLATTSNISDRDFANGNFNFSGGTGASVVNQGTIHARNGGSVVLSGSSVDNQGLIQADAGTVVLGGASAFTVDFDGDNLLRYAIAAPAGKADNGQTGVSNSGTVQANNGGRVIMTARAAADIAGAVINNTGIVSATSARLQNGEVVIDGGDGDVNVSGTITATGNGNGQTGGFVDVSGHNITVADNTQIDVSGSNGGGTVHIGGDLHGAGPLPNAANVHVGSATIKADATRRGNGGTLVVWSNGLTDFSGIFSAIGGAAGGNGGFIETSGQHLNVGDGAKVDTTAARGNTGTWLLDPTNIDINSEGGSNLSGSSIAPSAIIAGLNTSNVMLQATNAITVSSAVSYSSANALSLLAHGSIVVKASIQNASNGAINLIAGWDGTTTNLTHLTDAGVFGAVGGNVTIGGTSASGSVSVGTFSGVTTVAGANITLEADHGYAQIGFDGGGGSGNIVVDATGFVHVTAAQVDPDSQYFHAQIGNGGVFASGDNGGDISVNAAGDVVLTGGFGDYNYAQIGNGGDSESSGSNSGNIDVTAGGALTLLGNGDYAQIGNGGFGSLDTDSGDVTVVVTGDITLAGANNYGYVQIGNGGQNSRSAASGDVTVKGHGNLLLSSGGGEDGGFDFAQIGNGNGQANRDGTVSGVVFVRIDGTTTLVDSESGRNVVLGNRTGSDGTESGDFTLITGSIDDEDNLLASNVTRDLAGGDVIVGMTAGDLSDLGELSYTSSHTLSLLSTHGIDLTSDISSGAGAITLLAGWDGTTTDSRFFNGEGVFGNNGYDITLDASLQTLGAVTLRGHDITLSAGITAGTLDAHATGGITIDNEVSAGGAMTLTAHDDIVETEDGDLEGGDLTATSSNGGIDLFVGYNDFTGTVSLNAQNDVRFYNDDNTELGASTVGGQLYIESSGDVTQSAAIVAGSLAVQTDALDCDGECVGANVTLTDAGNTISGDVAFNVTGDVNFTDSVGFNLGRVIFHDVAYDSDIEDHTYVGGELTATALTGGITINGGIETGLNDIITDPTLTADGDITETEDGYILGGDLNVTSTNGRISLLGDNELIGTVSLNAAGDALFFNDTDTNLGASTVGGTLFVSSVGDVTQSGALSATNLVVEAIASECSCSEGDVLLDNAANAISGSVAFEADGDVTFKNSIGFTLADVDIDIDDIDETFSNDIGGDLTAIALSGGIAIDGVVSTGTGADPSLTAAGDIVETENGYITGAYLNVTSTSGNIALDNAQNALTGTVSLSAAGNASFANGRDTRLGTMNVLGDLTVLSEGDIYVTTSIQNAGSGDITLIAGWDGITTDPTHLTQFGAYGNGGDVEFGNADTNVAVGSASGTTTIAGHDIELSPTDGYEQIGYHGAGGGNIVVRATGDLILDGSHGYDAMIGNGSRTGDVTGNVGGNINIRVEFGATELISAVNSRGWIGNATGGAGKAHGDVTLVTDLGGVPRDMIIADLGNSADTGGDFFLGYTDPEDGAVIFGGMTYNSPHNFTIASPTDLHIDSSIQNAGSGAVTLVAGWDEETFGSAADLRAAGAYGLNDSTLTIGGSGNVAVGSAGGVTSALTTNLTFATNSGYAQLGYHGAGGGDIAVAALGDLSMTGGVALNKYAMIGNGSLNGGVSGNVTGNIDIQIGGTSSIVTVPGQAKAWIGNVAGVGFSETGNVFFQTHDFDDADGLGAMAAADLNGGDVTLAVTGSGAGGEIDDAIFYSSSHNFTLLIAGGLTISNSMQNAGSGAITIVTGWDGATFDAAHFGDAGVYGNNGGTLQIGGTNAVGNASVGSFGGATSVFAGSVVINAVHGTAQLGYHGAGHGAVNVTALNSVSLFTGANSLLALIGNGGTDIGGSIGGAVNVSTQGGVFLTAANQGAIAGIGNVGGFGASEGGTITVNTHGGALTMTATAQQAHTHIGNWTKNDTTGTSSGNITIDAGAVSLVATSQASLNQIGNGTFRFSNDTGALSGDILIHAASFQASATGNGQSRVGNLGLGAVSGNLSLFTTGNIVLTGNGGLVNIGNVSGPTDLDGNALQGHATGNLLVQSGGTLTLTASNTGNARIETGGLVAGTVTVSAAGDITLTAGTDGSSGSRSLAMIGALVPGNGGGNISVTSLNGGVYLSAIEGSGQAWIGNVQNGAGGTLSGSVSVTTANAANGNIALSATGAGASARIGNTGSDSETVGGDIFLTAGNTLTVGAGDATIGNRNSNPQGEGTVPAPFGGNLIISANAISGNVAPSLATDLSGGDVLLKIFGPSFTLNGPITYNSGHMLSVLAAGNIALVNSVQNAGSGAINLVAGWNGTTADAAHFFDAGVFGNNNGAILIGGAGATGNVAVGSAGGPTRLGAKDITLAAVNGYAQLGYHGASGGALTLNATGIVSLSGGANAALYAQIGNGTTFGSNAAGGDVSIASASIAGSANGAVTGANLKLAAASGNIGSITTALRIAASSLQLTTNGGSVFLTSPNGGVSFGGTGVNLGGGNLTLAAAGAITQTAAIHTAQTSLTTTSGDITLTNSDNGFGGLTIATPGNATLTHSSLLTIASANIGGTLTLNAGNAINQSGAIVAASLNASASNGTIVLSNAGNSFGTLSLHTFNGNDATIVDSSAVVLAGAVVGGKVTLTAGGAITQTGAIVAGQSMISTTSGDIVLTNSGNAFGPLTVVTPGNASFAQASLLTVAGANVGGTLTLNAGSIAQSGAIVAASLSATSTVGGIVLANAGNSFGTLSVHTTGPNDATVVDSTAVVIANSAVGGKFTLTAGGGVSQSGAIAAQSLNVATTAGNIALTNLANAVTGTVQFATPGAATFYDTSGMNVATTTVGGDLILLSKGNVNFRNSVQSLTGAITVVAGWDGVTVAPASFGNAGVFGNNTGPTTGNITIGGSGATGAVAVGSKSGTTSLYANNLSVIGVNGTAQLGYHGSGGGAILVRTLHDVTLGANVFSAMIGNGSLTSDVTGNQTGDIDLRAGGNLIFSGTAQTWLGNFAHSGSETGNLIAVMNDTDDSSDHRFSDYITAALGGGDVTIGFTGSDDQGPGNAVAYTSAHTLNILSVGNFVIAGSIQNAGTGAINLVAGWDGKTLNAASFGIAGVYGNNGKGLVIGGANAAGNAAFGSAGGTTSIYAASLALSAVHGYAQLGFNGHGAGAILVNTTGGVSLSGGAGAGQFAQIGNGGRGTSGNNSGTITINAGGDLVLTGGTGAEAYAQLGHGGAESNTGANGYSNVAPITITAANVLLNAGAGNAAYVQIGNGGYKSGLNLAGGTAVNGGAITITSGHAVSLTGNGADAYAQIGNGGSQSNTNAAAAAGGTDSGDIIVHAPNGAAGSVTLTAGSGGNAYSQIGNGGYAVNSGPTTTVANWTITGNVTVTDLALTGGTPGLNAYSQIGNGDASHNSTGNISGDIFIDANGQITYTPGTNPHSQATIGNFTGKGSVSGTLTGATPPPDLLADPVVIGVVVGNNPDNDKPGTNNNPITTIPTIVVPDNGPGGNSVVTLEHATPGPLAALDGNGDGDGPHNSDSATVVIADSLDGAHKAGAATILQGLLKAGLANGNAVHAVPPADQDFSSWGNEALWQ